MNDVIDWLLEDDNPSVRFFALTSLLGEPIDSPAALQARRAVMEDGAVAHILELQNEDGSWGEPERYYLDKYTGTSWTLLVLAELGASGGDASVRKACEFMLSNSQDPEGGGFSYSQSAKTRTGLASGVIPCLTGNMVYGLIKLGFFEDERVQEAIGWIIKQQRADDGVEEGPAGRYYERFEMCFGRHSCHMGVAKALKGLAAIPQEKRTPEVNAKIGELAEYFLKHRLYKKSHSPDEISRPGWLRLGFPLMYQTDILELLGIMTELGIRDPRLADAIAILVGKRGSDGKWKMENSNNGKTHIDIEKKGAPSKWITLKALNVLKEYS